MGKDFSFLLSIIMYTQTSSCHWFGNVVLSGLPSKHNSWCHVGRWWYRERHLARITSMLQEKFCITCGHTLALECGV